MGFGVWGLGFGVWGLGFGVWGLGFGVWGLGFGVWGLGFGVWGFAVLVLGFGVCPRAITKTVHALHPRKCWCYRVLKGRGFKEGYVTQGLLILATTPYGSRSFPKVPMNPLH